MEVSFKKAILGRENLSLELDLNDQGEIQKSSLVGVGDLGFLRSIAQFRKQLKGKLGEVPIPKGHSTADLMFKEVLLKAQNRWDLPYKEDEVCHCRAVPLTKVESAILVGAHTPEQVTDMTSTSTACGTCRPDVESIVNYYLQVK